MTHSSKKVYLDHAATTPMHPEVIEATVAAIAENYGNPSSLHAHGREAFGALEQARRQFARFLGATPREIVFTSGGTESDNTAIVQAVRKKAGTHVITTSVEHQAVLEPVKELEKQGYTVTYLPVNAKGMVSLSDLQEALTDETVLVSIMSVNNETGTRMPIEEIGVYLKEHAPGVLFHTDAVQAFGLFEIDVKKMGIDLLSATAHKLNGPKGVGLLYVREGIGFIPYLKGGAQELNKRAGTVNVPGIIGFQKATELMVSKNKQRKALYEQLREHVLHGLREHQISFEINGDETAYSPHILNLWIKEIPSARLLTLLDLAGISVAAGSACSAGNPEPSHVLEAMYGHNHPAVSESIRISFGLGNTVADVDHFLQVLAAQAKKYHV